MSQAVDVVIREALPEDAEKLLAVSQQIGEETEFLVMDGTGMDVDPQSLAFSLEQLHFSPNNLILLVFVDEELAGMASVRASEKERVNHIGEIGISLLKEFWGFGLGSLLMEELIAWAQESGIIRRLELTVQARNPRAIHLYENFGFNTEVIMKRGAKSNAGEFLDVHLMSLLID